MDPMTHEITTYSEDIELQAIEIILHALDGMLDDDITRMRVLGYVNDRKKGEAIFRD